MPRKHLLRYLINEVALSPERKIQFNTVVLATYVKPCYRVTRRLSSFSSHKGETEPFKLDLRNIPRHSTVNRLSI